MAKQTQKMKNEAAKAEAELKLSPRERAAKILIRGVGHGRIVAEKIVAKMTDAEVSQVIAATKNPETQHASLHAVQTSVAARLKLANRPAETISTREAPADTPGETSGGEEVTQS